MRTSSNGEKRGTRWGAEGQVPTAPELKRVSLKKVQKKGRKGTGCRENSALCKCTAQSSKIPLKKKFRVVKEEKVKENGVCRGVLLLRIGTGDLGETMGGRKSGGGRGLKLRWEDVKEERTRC